MSDQQSIEKVPSLNEKNQLAPDAQGANSINDIKHDSDLENQDHKTYNSSDNDIPLEEKSIGVQKAELLAAQWDKWYYKVILLISAFICGYAYGLDLQVRYVYTGYASASFSEHSRLATISVITGFIAAGAQPVYARLSDVFGRLELFLVNVVFYVIGSIIQSQATTFPKYAAGDVFYTLGYVGIILILLLIMSDFSTLRFRFFYDAVPTFPFIINTWISGNVTAAVGFNWKWGIGMFAFIFPLCCIPIVCCMLHMRWLASKTEEWKVFKQRKTKFQELGLSGFLKYLFWQIDVLGVFFMVTTLGCILIPISVAGGVDAYWRQYDNLLPFLIGWVICLPLFIVWEAKFARQPVLPLSLIGDRGVWSAMIISFLLDFISGVESTYLYTVLIVAVGESEKSATRISSLSSFVSTLAALFYGLAVVKLRRLKAMIIFGCVLWIIAFGILIRYRSGDFAHSGIIGGLCVLGLGTSFFSYPISVSAMASVSHEHMAIVVGAIYMAYRVGSSVGSAIAAAMWSKYLYPELTGALNGNVTLATSVYSDPYTFAITYPFGTPERDAVVPLYGTVQKKLMILCLCLCIPMVVAAFFLRDHELGLYQSYDGVEERQKQQSFLEYLKLKLKSPFTRSGDMTESEAPPEKRITEKVLEEQKAV